MAGKYQLTEEDNKFELSIKVNVPSSLESS